MAVLKKYYISEMSNAPAIVMHLVESNRGQRVLIGFDVEDANEVHSLMSLLLNPDEWELGYFKGKYYFIIAGVMK